MRGLAGGLAALGRKPIVSPWVPACAGTTASAAAGALSSANTTPSVAPAHAGAHRVASDFRESVHAVRSHRLISWLGILVIAVLLTACGGSKNTRPSSRGSGSSSSSRGYDDIRKGQSSRYRSRNDSVPTDAPDVSKLPEPVPKVEPRSLYGNKSPYSVLGQTYTVLPSPRGYVERGIASFYGNKFHGYKTSSLEEYDMYQFSAAHKTLPLPSYARVTNLENGKSVIVRINDRGPFHENRIIDLSFAAAVRIGVWPKGTGLVEVRAIDPSEAGSDRGAPYVNTAPKPAPITAPPLPPRAPVGAASAAIRRQRAPLPQAAIAAEAAPARAAVPPSPRTVAAPAAAVGAMPVPEETDGYGDGTVTGMTHVSPAEALPPAAGSVAAVPTGSITPPVPGKPSIYLQVGAFSDAANAQRVADQLNRAGLGPVSVVEFQAGGRSLRRVRVGPLSDVDTADRLTDRIAGMGLPRPQVAVD